MDATELQRQVSNMIRIGVISGIDEAAPTCRYRRRATTEEKYTQAQVDAEFLAGRKAGTNPYWYSYEVYSVRCAIKDFGIQVIDVSGDSHLLPVADSNCDVAKFNRLVQNDGTFTYGNLQTLKARLTYVENYSPNGPAGGAYNSSLLAPLYPVNN